MVTLKCYLLVDLLVGTSADCMVRLTAQLAFSDVIATAKIVSCACFLFFV